MQDDGDARSPALIRDYTLEMVQAKCHPGENIWSVRVHLEQDIGDALPYLNAVFDAKFYDHDHKAITFDHEGRHYSMRPKEIGIFRVEDTDDAAAAAKATVERINDIWSRHGEIEPRCEGRTQPFLMDIYRLLPRTNCGKCGRPTCMAFAADLREGKAGAGECPPLGTPASKDDRKKIEDLFRAG